MRSSDIVEEMVTSSDPMTRISGRLMATGQVPLVKAWLDSELERGTIRPAAWKVLLESFMVQLRLVAGAISAEEVRGLGEYIVAAWLRVSANIADTAEE